MNLISFIADKRKICRELNKDEGVVHMILCHIYGIEPSSLYLHYYKEINDDLTNKYSQILKDLGFSPYKNVWLGRKYFKDYGNNVKEVINSIVETVAKIKNDIDLI